MINDYTLTINKTKNPNITATTDGYSDSNWGNAKVWWISKVINSKAKQIATAHKKESLVFQTRDYW